MFKSELPKKKGGHLKDDLQKILKTPGLENESEAKQATPGA
jgi:hypothetical protein